MASVQTRLWVVPSCKMQANVTTFREIFSCSARGKCQKECRKNIRKSQQIWHSELPRSNQSSHSHLPPRTHTPSAYLQLVMSSDQSTKSGLRSPLLAQAVQDSRRRCDVARRNRGSARVLRFRSFSLTQKRTKPVA